MRGVLAAAALVALGLVAGCGETREPARDTESRGAGTPSGRLSFPGANLLLISIDTLRADRVGAYGYERGTTPFLDELAESAIIFEDAYATSPKTASSHMSLFTSMLPTEHGVTNASARLGIAVRRVAENRPTLPQVLRDANYWNVAIAGGGNLMEPMGFGKGFRGHKPNAPSRFFSRLADVRAMVDNALDFARRIPQLDKPAFLFTHTYQVHSPYNSPRRYRERFAPDSSSSIVGPIARKLHDTPGVSSLAAVELWEREDEFTSADNQHLSDLYDAAIAYTDDELRRFFDELATLDLIDPTIVVILSDHGEEFGEHGNYEHDQLYTEHLHVPLIVRLPGGAHGGTRVSGLCSLIDVFPTLMELLEIDGPDTMQGTSLVNAIKTGATDGLAPVSEHVMFADHYRATRRTASSAVMFDAAAGTVEGWDIADDPRQLAAPTDGLAGAHRNNGEQLNVALVRAFARRAALDAEDAGEAVPLSTEQLEALEALNYVESETVLPEGTPLDAWPHDG